MVDCSFHIDVFKEALCRIKSCSKSMKLKSFHVNSHLEFIISFSKNIIFHSYLQTKFLCTLGGCNVGDIVRRILRHILTDSFAVDFNWLGRGGKKLAFASYNICNVVRGKKTYHRVQPFLYNKRLFGGHIEHYWTVTEGYRFNPHP